MGQPREVTFGEADLLQEIERLGGQVKDEYRAPAADDPQKT